MNMHWVTANINLNGQGFHIVNVNAEEPISWPEAQLLMLLHGEENITDIKPCSVGDSTARAEKQRLAVKYQAWKAVDQVFPGRDPRMEMMMPGEEENQPRVDNEGKRLPPGVSVPVNGDDDDDDDSDDVKRDPPVEQRAVFAPGRPRQAGA